MRLAQTNIALFRWPLDDPKMAEFVASIDVMNRLAEASDGFIWRYKETYRPREAEFPFDNPLLFFNLSVWRDFDSLKSYVFDSAHRNMLENKSQWVRSTGTPSTALWWIADDAEMPTVDDAIKSLESLATGSDSGVVFTFSDFSQGG